MLIDPLPTPPAFEIRRELVGHKGAIHRIAWSSDGRTIASASVDGTVRLWDAVSERVDVLHGHTDWVYCVAWDPRSALVASASADMTVKVWEAASGKEIHTFPGHTARVFAVAWSPNGAFVASGGMDGLVVRTHSGRLKGQHRPGCWINALAWSPDSGVVAAGGGDDSVRLWDVHGDRLIVRLEGHDAYVVTLAWSKDGSTIISGSYDQTIRVWKQVSGHWRPEVILEGHTGFIKCVALSSDETLLASKANDGTVRIWRTDTWAHVLTIDEEIARAADVDSLPDDWTTDWDSELVQHWPAGLAFNPTNPMDVAVLGRQNRCIRILRLRADAVADRVVAPEPYVTAKIALVGDQLVGKTSLAHRLISGEFKLFPRTHGQQFWTFPQISDRRADGAECEAILWDLAGQADYRLTHSLFLEDAHLALVLFNASERQQPLKGPEYWLKVLRMQSGTPCASILVATQSDTGDLSVTPGELEEFCRANGVTGGYVVTSAASGRGIDALLQSMRREVRWDDIPATITTTAFRRIKDRVLALKAEARAHVLITPGDLLNYLNATHHAAFTAAEVDTAITHAANHGLVAIVRTPTAEPRILLRPDLLINLAASIVLEARRNPKGLGALKEADVLGARLQLPELEGLGSAERSMLLDAAVALFLRRNVCVRETLGTETLLVFPALIHQKRPPAVGGPVDEDVSYVVEGAVEHLYSAMVVLLGYTNTFARTNQWHDSAEYVTPGGDLCGVKQVAEREGSTTLILYYEADVAAATRRLFEGLCETFLLSRNVRVTKYPAVACTRCHYRQERDEIIKRVGAGKGFMWCADCGKKIVLPKVGETLSTGRKERAALQQERATAQTRTAYEACLAHVKGIVRDRGSRKPRCFLSYAWGNAAQERWVATLVEDLQRADILVVFDRYDAPITTNVARFITEGIADSDFIIMIGTRRYLSKFRKSGTVVAAEMDLIHQRLTGTERAKGTVVPVLLDGDEASSLPPLACGRVYLDCRDPKQYLIGLFDLVLRLHGVPLTDAAVADLRLELREARATEGVTRA